MLGKAVARGLVLVVWLTMGLVAAPRAAEARTGELVGDDALQEILESYVGQLGGAYGVAVVNLDDGRSVFINAHETFPTASQYKLLVMYRVFQMLESGELSSTDTVTIAEADMVEVVEDEDLWAGDTLSVAGALEAMITVSSNAAAYALTRMIGGWGAVASAADELGMGGTILDDGFWSTPADMAGFFDLLAHRGLVSESSSDQMIGLLLRQTINNRLPALLPAEAVVAHKTGDLEDVRNDGGIVWGPGGYYVIALMSRGSDPYEAIQAESEISRIVYDWYGA